MMINRQRIRDIHIFINSNENFMVVGGRSQTIKNKRQTPKTYFLCRKRHK